MYEFTLIAAGKQHLTENLADRLFEAGCDDSSPATCDGVLTVTFHCEADSLQHAISSAIADVQAAGIEVVTVQMEAAAVAHQAE